MIMLSPSSGVLWPVVVPLGWLLAVSAPLAVTDARTGRLPNAQVVPALVLTGWALLAVGLVDPSLGLGSAGAVVAAATAAGLLRAAGALGMGDVKLLLPLVALTALLSRADPGVPASVALWTAALAAVALVPTLLDAEKGRTPLGPALLGGFWLGVAAALVPP